MERKCTVRQKKSQRAGQPIVVEAQNSSAKQSLQTGVWQSKQSVGQAIARMLWNKMPPIFTESR